MIRMLTLRMKARVGIWINDKDNIQVHAQRYPKKR